MNPINKYFFVSIFCSVFLLLTAFSATSVYAAGSFDPEKIHGPRIEKLCMVIITNADSQVLAAEKGEIDIISDITRPSDIDRLSMERGLSMSLARGFHAFFILLNNKARPWDDPDVRHAAAEAIDRNNMVRTIYSGYCEPINSWLPPVSPWSLPDSTKNIYDKASSKNRLRAKGYKWSLTGDLIYPDGTPMPRMKLLTPLARVAPTTAELAEQIADSLRSVGFPVDVEPMDFSAMVGKLDRKEYSLGVIAWSMGRNPDSLYSFYHSSMDIPGGYNMTSIEDHSLDDDLLKLRYAKNRAEAEAASEKSQRRLAELMPSIPVYSRFSVSAVSKKWKNVFANEKMTADNIWTLLMAEPADGKERPLNMVLAEEPRNLNPFAASSAYSWQILGLIYESLIGTDPFTLDDMPSLAESWSVETVGKGKNEHTKLTFRLRKNLRWSDGSPLTAEDLKTTFDFLREKKVPRFFDSVKNIRSVRAENGTQIIVDMEGTSYWYLDNIGGLPCMPAKVLKKVTDWQNWNPLDPKGKFGPHGLLGSGPFMLDEYKPGEFVMMKRNGHYRMLETGKTGAK
ncbi:MAG: ABC transporter substrate-binding protein [Synergistaceae bacterium]|nr:ABC transporter substrate-binding protein [Synergistaceae bacterium]